MKSQFPNIVTGCNLICGCIAVVLAISGNTAVALLFIILGAVFDFGDGMSARALKVSSPIGKELDSLADVITFGFAPSAIIFYELLILDYPYSLAGASNLIPYLAFIMTAFSASRLAKFNIDERQTTSFIGLPTPANALFWGSFIVGWHQYFENMRYAFLLILLLTFISCYLLICEMPMFALKFKHWGINDPLNRVKYGFILFSLVVFLAFLIAGIAVKSIAVIILAYILVSFIMWRIQSNKNTL
jgi:CDP-diacylglycerol--serine O-phosphatidyltransferase